jgi:hypothetical protein
VEFEAWLKACYGSENVHDGCDNRIKVEIDVIAADIMSKSLGPVSSLMAGVLGAHVRRVEDTHANFLA